MKGARRKKVARKEQVTDTSTASPRLMRRETSKWGPAQNVGVYAAIVLLHLLFSSGMRAPTALYDELVYLGFGRFFGGAAPLPNIRGGAYGAFGYGLFISPAFAAAPSFFQSYHTVLVLNAVLISSSYFLLYYIARKYLNLPHYPALVLSGVTCLYPSFLLFSNYAISENAFIPCFLLTAMVAGRLVFQPTFPTAVTFGFLSGFLYTIHSRALAIIAATVILLIVLTVRRLVPLSTALCALAMLVCVVAITRAVNANLIAKGWGGGGEVTIAPTLAALASWPGVKHALIAVTGELFYAVTTTFGLYVFGLGYMIIRSWRSLRHPTAKDERTAVLLAYCLACVLGVLAVSSVFMSAYDVAEPRPDFLMTGRYQEGVLALVVLMGLALLFESRVRGEFRRAFGACHGGVLVSVAVCSLLIVPRFRNLDWLHRPAPRINIFAAMGVLRFLRGTDFALLGMFCLLMFFVISYLNRVSAYLAVACIAVLFVSNSAVEFYADVLEDQRVMRVAFRGSEAGDSPTLLGILLKGFPRVHEVSYDMAAWHAFLYTNYQLWEPEKDLVQFDSRSGQSPRSELVIAGRSWLSASGTYYLAGCEQTADNCLFVRQRSP